jgi:hypothetical protein
LIIKRKERKEIKKQTNNLSHRYEVKQRREREGNLKSFFCLSDSTLLPLVVQSCDLNQRDHKDKTNALSVPNAPSEKFWTMVEVELASVTTSIGSSSLSNPAGAYAKPPSKTR